MRRPRIGVFKFASCDGCQLTVLNMEEELLDLVELTKIDFFREASDRPLKGIYDIAIIEGSISTGRQKEEIVDIRERTRNLVTIGACATSGGLQALRNWANLTSYKEYVYPSPEMINALSTSTPISDHVHVDYELWGCPVNKAALLEMIVSYLLGKGPTIPKYSLCMECKRKGIPCLLISRSEPCLGPITKAGCGAICMSFGRACYGCFGPRDDVIIGPLLSWFKGLGLTEKDCLMLLDKMNTYAYRKARLAQNY